MKITHIALNGPFTDGWSYQDNLLPKYHQRNGLDVSIITSKFIYNKSGNISIDDRDKYINENGIEVIRLTTKGKATINSKFKRYYDLEPSLISEKPDILFIHGVQFLDIRTIIGYIRKKPNTIVYVDNHADFSNSATNWISKNVLHGIIWKKTAQMIEPYTTKFYGVLPARVDFLANVYKLPKNKLELLVMGADDDEVEKITQNNFTEEYRFKHNIKSDDFLIVTGGKIDLPKMQTLNLMKAIKIIDRTDVRLLVFGSVVDELKNEFYELVDDEKIQYIGWISQNESYKYFAASDLVVFSGRHSVFWEQVVALGIPMIVKHWEGTTHIDIGGNVKFLNEDSVQEIESVIRELVKDNFNIYEHMKKSAQSERRNEFLYSNIAYKSLKDK